MHANLIVPQTSRTSRHIAGIRDSENIISLHVLALPAGTSLAGTLTLLFSLTYEHRVTNSGVYALPWEYAQTHTSACTDAPDCFGWACRPQQMSLIAPVASKYAVLSPQIYPPCMRTIARE